MCITNPPALPPNACPPPQPAKFKIVLSKSCLFFVDGGWEIKVIQKILTQLPPYTKFTGFAGGENFLWLQFETLVSNYAGKTFQIEIEKIAEFKLVEREAK